MAHTPRRPEDKRKHPLVFSNGQRVGVHMDGGPVYGKVYSVDEGGWIYVNWEKACNLPTWLRATQVFKVT